MHWEFASVCQCDTDVRDAGNDRHVPLLCKEGPNQGGLIPAQVEVTWDTAVFRFAGGDAEEWAPEQLFPTDLSVDTLVRQLAILTANAHPC